MFNIKIPKCVWIATVFFITITVQSYAQNKIKGIVKEKGAETLPGASVVIAGTNEGVVTDINGSYELNTNQNFPLTIVISLVGYKTDSLFLNHYTGDVLTFNL